MSFLLDQNVAGIIMMTLLLPAAIAGTQGATRNAAPEDVSWLMGNWRGESSCVARNTACHDEMVVYHLANLPDGYVSISADKIVNGNAINMGTLEFRYDPDESTLICEYSQGVWRLKVNGDRMQGTLIGKDGAEFRRVQLRRE